VLKYYFYRGRVNYEIGRKKFYDSSSDIQDAYDKFDQAIQDYNIAIKLMKNMQNVIIIEHGLIILIIEILNKELLI